VSRGGPGRSGRLRPGKGRGPAVRGDIDRFTRRYSQV